MIRRAALGLVATVLAACRPEAETGPLLAFLGDSLTSGWRLPEAEAYPALVGRALREHGGRPVRVLNAGASGDTVAQGLARLEPVLSKRPAVLVVALGINDGLRGLSLEDAERDLAAIVDRGQAIGARVVLVGMRIPSAPRGPEYAERFAALYPRLAASRRTHFVPFLLEGVAGVPDLNFPDGLHPNAAGHARLARNVLRQVELALAEVEPGRASLSSRPKCDRGIRETGAPAALPPGRAHAPGPCCSAASARERRSPSKSARG